MDILGLKIVIMAGGKGTRISSIATDIPKPMIKIADKPILEHQIDFLREQGAKQITVIAGHLGNVIMDYFGDGSKWNVEIGYIVEEKPLGTAGALKLIKLSENPLLLINGDILYDIDLQRMIDFYVSKKADITLFTHPNQHSYDSALIETDETARIIKWMNKEDKREDYQNRVNAGIHILSPEVLDMSEDHWKNEKIDLDRDILKPNIDRFKIFAYDSPEYVKDMGTPERYYQVQRDFEKGVVHAKNLSKKQKAIFLDRDGTVNRYAGFVTIPEQIQLLDGAAEAIKKINQSDYLAIIVTNQPVIARGDCTDLQLKIIHNRLERLLGEQGAYLDDIAYCPHHPDKGYAGEISELKIECNCRKPKPGMLFDMARKYNIDLSQSFMIGDGERDIGAGIAAGCRTVYLGRTTDTLQKADICKNSLLEAVTAILDEE